ncbi:hypothetical protein K501DRAFT_299839, partial [Backusella circina FSU 941]
SISLPKSKGIKYPGRSPKLPRLSSLKKDYNSSEYRKRMLLYGKRVLISTEANRKDEKHQEEPAKKIIKFTKRKTPLSHKKKRLNTTEKQHFVDAHPSINKDNIRSIFDPKGDSHCRYRAISHIRYNNQYDSPKVIAGMLVAFEKNKDVYKNVFIYDIDRLEKNIRAGMDENSPKVPELFVAPDCAQVVADAFDVPVCIPRPVRQITT